MIERRPPVTTSPVRISSLLKVGDWGRMQWMPMDRSAQCAAAILLILIALALSGQLFDPYISHDDYPFLFPSPFSDFNNMGLREGRYLYYFWPQLTPYLTTSTSFLLYLAALLAICSIISFRHNQYTILTIYIFLSIIGSPFVLDQSTWPTANLPAPLMTVLFAALYPYSESKSSQRVAVFVAVFLVFQAYPPFALCVVAIAFMTKVPTIREALAQLVTAWVAFLLSALLSFSLNFILHDHFGVKLSAWRDPHPPQSLDDIAMNLMFRLEYYWSLISHLALYLGAYTAGVLTLTDWRRRAIATVPMVFGFSIDLAIALVTGVEGSLRIYIWLAFASLVPFFYLEDYGARWLSHRLAGTALVLVCCFLWLNLVRNYAGLNAAKRQQYIAAETVTRAALEQGVAKLLLLDATQLRGKNPDLDFVSLMHFERGYQIQYCGWSINCDGLDKSRFGIYVATLNGENYLVLNFK